MLHRGATRASVLHVRRVSDVVPMSSPKETLRRIGLDLDLDRTPSVLNGGIVVPCGVAGIPVQGREQCNGKRAGSEPRQPSTPAASRAPASPGASTASRASTASEAASILSERSSPIATKVNELGEAYPTTRFWFDDDGLLIDTRSALLPASWIHARFVLAMPFDQSVAPRAWGFWDGLGWIGPRHTNFPDGSICSYEPRDGTWTQDASWVELLDLHTLWAVRHLHLQIFGRWPGMQSVADPYERLSELGDDELCGCDLGERRRYRDCCKANDLARSPLRAAVKSLMLTGGERKPPEAIKRFVADDNDVPCLSSLLRLSVH